MSNTVILHHSKAVIPRKITVLPCTLREEKSARIKDCELKSPNCQFSIKNTALCKKIERIRINQFPTTENQEFGFFSLGFLRAKKKT